MRRYAFAALAFCLSGVGLFACAGDEKGDLDDRPRDDNRLPAGDAASVDASDSSAIADPCVPEALCPSGPFTASGEGFPFDSRMRINVIRGRSASDVWIGGAHGGLAHFDGQRWTRSDIGREDSLRAFWLRHEGEIAIASQHSMFTRGIPVVDAGAPSAGGWIAYGSPPADGSILSPSSGWAPGDATWFWLATLQSYADNEPSASGLWRLRVDPSTHELALFNVAPDGLCIELGCKRMTSIHGVSADDLWAVGPQGATMHITGAQTETPIVRPVDSATVATLHGVWAASATDAWSVGARGTLRHFTGNPVQWDIADADVDVSLNAIWGTSSNDVWVVGDDALVLHYDGDVWSRVPVGGLEGARPDLYAVWTAEPGHVWIGGDGVVLSIGGKP